MGGNHDLRVYKSVISPSELAFLAVPQNISPHLDPPSGNYFFSRIITKFESPSPVLSHGSNLCFLIRNTDFLGNYCKKEIGLRLDFSIMISRGYYSDY